MFEFCPQVTNCRSQHSRESARNREFFVRWTLPRDKYTDVTKKTYDSMTHNPFKSRPNISAGMEIGTGSTESRWLESNLPLVFKWTTWRLCIKKDLNGLWGGGRKILSLRCTIYNLFCLAAQNQLKLYEGAWWGFLILLHLESFWLSNLHSLTTWSDEWSFIILD